MISHLKLLILINWKEEGKWPFLRFLRNTVQHVEFLQPLSFNHPMLSRLNHLSKYLSEFYVPFQALIRRKRFDVIISWQMRIGISYGLLKRITNPGNPPIHVIQDFHIDLTQKGWWYRIKIALLKLAIPGIDFFFCTSSEEKEIYSQLFGIPKYRIEFLPLVPPLSYFEEPASPIKDYIFSYGNSDRDFDTLVRAVASLNINTYILSARYQPLHPIPENVSIIRDRISEKELIQWIASSRIVILPLQDYRISAGQLSMLEVMALARPLIITANMATKEYADHQQTALFFDAGNDEALAEHIGYLWSHREVADQIGEQARKNALKLIDRRMVTFERIFESCMIEIEKGVQRCNLEKPS